MHCEHRKDEHDNEDQLTKMTMNENGTVMLTGDTAGRLKLWDISNVNWQQDGFTKEGISKNMRCKWFI